MSSASAAQSNVQPHDLVYGRLTRLVTAAMLPWMLVSFLSIMAFDSPNAIVTPLTWAILVCIWSYPVVMLAGRVSARVLRVYGQYDRANLFLSVPSAMGAFLFALLVVPIAIMPFFSDGYFGLMASCLVSMLVANWAMRRLRR